MSDAQLKEANITRLPGTLMEAMQALIMDDKLKSALVNGLSMQLVGAPAAAAGGAGGLLLVLGAWSAGWLPA
jgi:hypothetical protein